MDPVGWVLENKERKARTMGVNIRSKGQRGEREAAGFIMQWAEEVTIGHGLASIELTRNLQQARAGGYDLVGIDWLALEIKRHENLQVSQWWKQAVRQAGPGQIPLLMYRQNRTPWRFRVTLTAAHYAPCGHSGTSRLTVDMDAEQTKAWFQHELWVRLNGKG